MFACRLSAVLSTYCICLAFGFCYLSSCQTFIHQMKTLTGRQLWKAQCNNRSLVCKNPIIIKKICSASPRSQCHFTLCCSWWALGCCPSVIIVTLMVAGWKTASCPAEWHRDPSIIQFSAQQAVIPQKSLGVLRFSLASLKLHVLPECSQFLNHNLSQRKKTHSGFIAASGHYGPSKDFCHVELCQTAIMGGFWCKGFFGSASSAALLLKKLWTRTILKFCVSQMPTVFLHAGAYLACYLPC